MTTQTTQTTQVEEAPKSNNPLHAAGKLVGELVLTPGTSLLLDGQIKSGVGHVVVGVLARALLGAPGMLLVVANSYASSLTGKSLLENMSSNSK